VSAIKLLFFLGIGVLFIWLFMRQLTAEQKSEIWVSLKNANYFWAVVSIILGIFSHLLRAIRWKMLLSPMGYKPGISNTFAAVMAGYLANLALPRLGEVTRCTILVKYEKIPLQKSFGTVVVERAIDMLIFTGLFFINLYIQFNNIKEYVYDKIYAPLSGKFAFLQNLNMLFYYMLALGMILILILYIYRRRFSHLPIYKSIRSLILGFIDGLKSVVRVRRPLLFVFISLLIWVMYFLMLYVCLFSFTETSGLGFHAAFAMLIFGSIGIIIVQGGIGIYPAILAETAAIYGVASTTGYALGWFAWSAQTIIIIALGVAALILLPLINRNGLQAQASSGVPKQAS
jgi:hypothetical protein